MNITEMLGIEYPIIQGAMAIIANHQLASAVSEAGGLGIIASGGLSGEQLREEIRKTKELTDKPFGVNIMLQMKNCDEIVDVIIEEEVKVVTTGAGTPKKYMPALKEADIKVIPVIAAVKHAKKMEAAGADAVVAEGQEAGGHIGQTSTMSLIPQIVDAVDIPVLAAGGVGDGRSVAAMFALGAQGVQSGTRFLASEESPIPDAYKQRLVEAGDTETIVVNRKLRDPVRALTNELLEEHVQMEYTDSTPEELKEHLSGTLMSPLKDGDTYKGQAMSGEVAGLIKEVAPAKQIIKELFNEAEEVAKDLTIN